MEELAVDRIFVVDFVIESLQKTMQISFPPRSGRMYSPYSHEFTVLVVFSCCRWDSCRPTQFLAMLWRLR